MYIQSKYCSCDVLSLWSKTLDSPRQLMNGADHRPNKDLGSHFIHVSIWQLWFTIINSGVMIHRCIDYRDTKMPRYASRYKTTYRDTDYFLGSHKTSSKYTKNTEFYLKQNLFKNISTSYLTFSPQKSLKFSLTKMPDRRLKKLLTIKFVLRVAHQR